MGKKGKKKNKPLVKNTTQAYECEKNNDLNQKINGEKETQINGQNEQDIQKLQENQEQNIINEKVRLTDNKEIKDQEIKNKQENEEKQEQENNQNLKQQKLDQQIQSQKEGDKNENENTQEQNETQCQKALDTINPQNIEESTQLIQENTIVQEEEQQQQEEEEQKKLKLDQDQQEQIQELKMEQEKQQIQEEDDQEQKNFIEFSMEKTDNNNDNNDNNNQNHQQQQIEQQNIKKQQENQNTEQQGEKGDQIVKKQENKTQDEGLEQSNEFQVLKYSNTLIQNDNDSQKQNNLSSQYYHISGNKAANQSHMKSVLYKQQSNPVQSKQQQERINRDKMNYFPLLNVDKAQDYNQQYSNQADMNQSEDSKSIPQQQIPSSFQEKVKTEQSLRNMNSTNKLCSREPSINSAKDLVNHADDDENKSQKSGSSLRQSVDRYPTQLSQKLQQSANMLKKKVESDNKKFKQIQRNMNSYMGNAEGIIDPMDELKSPKSGDKKKTNIKRVAKITTHQQPATFQKTSSNQMIYTPEQVLDQVDVLKNHIENQNPHQSAKNYRKQSESYYVDSNDRIKKFKVLLAQGNQYLQNKRFQESISVFSEASQIIHPDYFKDDVKEFQQCIEYLNDCFSQISKANFELGRYEICLGLCNNILQTDTDNYEIMQLKSICQKKMGLEDQEVFQKQLEQAEKKHMLHVTSNLSGSMVFENIESPIRRESNQEFDKNQSSINLQMLSQLQRLMFRKSKVNIMANLVSSSFLAMLLGVFLRKYLLKQNGQKKYAFLVALITGLAFYWASHKIISKNLKNKKKGKNDQVLKPQSDE